HVEAHRVAAVDDLLCRKRGFGLCLIEDKSLGAYLESFLHERTKFKGTEGCFWGENRGSELKKLLLTDALLTTTGCGPAPQRQQPIGPCDLPVNRFVAKSS